MFKAKIQQKKITLNVTYSSHKKVMYYEATKHRWQNVIKATPNWQIMKKSLMDKTQIGIKIQIRTFQERNFFDTVIW